MSIVTLRSTEDFGGATTTAGAAVNFQNYFKDPIYFKKDDTIEITSVTINQTIKNFLIGPGNNEIQFRIGDADPNGETPFYQLHRVRIPEGEYEGIALAQALTRELNNNLTLFGYTFTCSFSAADSKFSIDLTQSTPVTQINTTVQNQGVRIQQPATFLPQYPMCPINPAPSLANLFQAFFSGENQNPNFTPSQTDQLTLLAQASNHNKAALTPSSNPITGKAYQYAFDRPIDERLGEHNMSINPSFTLVAVDLLQLDFPGGVPPPTIQKHVLIENILGQGQNRIYTVSATGTGVGLSNTDPYYYKLEDTTKFIGLPEAVALVSPNAITGINSSTNNILSGGAAYQAGEVILSSVGPDNPVVEVLTVDAGTGAVLTYRMIYPGSGIANGQAVTFPHNRPGQPNMVVSMGVGGFRTSAVGVNSAATPPPAANIVVGNTYKCFFPTGSYAHPVGGGAAGSPITRTQVDNDANAIDLNVKVTSIDATTRAVTGVEFVSCGLRAHTPDFDRLIQVINSGQSKVMLADGNNNIHTPQASWITISQLRSNGDDTPLYFGNTLDGLCFLNDIAGNQPLTPAGAQVSINGVSTSCVFSMMQNDGVKTRAYIKNVGRLQQIDTDVASASFGNYISTANGGLKISRYDNTTGNTADLRTQTKKTKVNYEFNLARGQLMAELPADSMEGYDDFFCRTTNVLYHLRTDGANRGGILPLSPVTIEVGVRNYEAGDFFGTGPGTETIVYRKDMNSVQIPNYNMDKIDKLGWGITRLNELTWTLDQDSPDPGWTPITYTFFQAGAIDADDNPIRESIFPLIPVMKLSQGLSIEEQVSLATPPVASAFIPGQSYVNIQGKYHTKQASIFVQNNPPNNYNQSEAVQNLIQPPGITASVLEQPSQDPTILNQTGAGNTTLIQTPYLFKFGEVVPSQTTVADNPVPGVGGATSINIGAIDLNPNSSNMAITLGMDEVVNKNDTADGGPTSTVTSSVAGEKYETAPTVFLEFPDFNIKGYTGAAADKFPIVATIPTEEWSTGLNDGTLHYKPLFPLPIDVNLPEDKPIYTMTARIRNLDGTLAKNLSNPTTITFYKKQREGKAMEDAIRNMRSEKQDNNISMRTNDFPIGTR